MTAYHVPLPDPEKASQYFEIFESAMPDKSSTRVYANVPREDDKGTVTMTAMPVLSGGRARYLEPKALPYGYKTGPGVQLTNRVAPGFSNEVFEHPTQKGFSLDHVHTKLNVFEIEATLYEGRTERLEKLNELRKNNRLLTIVCDMGVFKDYIISDVSPVMSSGSANTFAVDISFQEVRRVELVSPTLTSYKDADEVHGNDVKDGGKSKLTLKRVEPPEEKGFWDKAMDGFLYLTAELPYKAFGV